MFYLWPNHNLLKCILYAIIQQAATKATHPHCFWWLDLTIEPLFSEREFFVFLFNKEDSKLLLAFFLSWNHLGFQLASWIYYSTSWSSAISHHHNPKGSSPHYGPGRGLQLLLSLVPHLVEALLPPESRHPPCNYITIPKDHLPTMGLIEGCNLFSALCPIW
jgi:hypothetical protein